MTISIAVETLQSRPHHVLLLYYIVYITTLLFNIWSKQPNEQEEEKKTEKCVISNKTLICALRPNDQSEKEIQGYLVRKNPFSPIDQYDWKNEKKEKIQRIIFFCWKNWHRCHVGGDAGCYDKIYTATITEHTYKRNRCCLCKQYRQTDSLSDRKN